MGRTYVAPSPAATNLSGYGADDSLALTDLGLLLRVQRIGDALLSRPLFLIEQWLESEYYCARGHLPLEGVPASAVGANSRRARTWLLSVGWPMDVRLAWVSAPSD
ncbi:hypothetical protein GCM10010254_23950 [Streptomyces chromofuscus]|nr:hypothetical protein GCM10010254_23950 [Streptomyces chromofuscus]